MTQANRHRKQTQSQKQPQINKSQKNNIKKQKQKHIKKIEKIRKLHDDNKSNPEIANEMNMKCSYISDIIRSYKQNRTISTPNICDFTIENWLNNTKQINNCLFI